MQDKKQNVVIPVDSFVHFLHQCNLNNSVLEFINFLELTFRMKNG